MSSGTAVEITEAKAAEIRYALNLMTPVRQPLVHDCDWSPVFGNEEA